MALFTLNFQILALPTGFLKFFEAILGCICIGLFTTLKTQGFYMDFIFNSVIFLIITISFTASASLILISMVVSPFTSKMLPKTIFEFLFHLLGFLFLVTVSISMLVCTYNNLQEDPVLEKAVAYSVLGLLNCALHAASARFAFKSFRED